MRKKKDTEQRLIDAINLLVSGKPVISDGRITQENIALEAGVSRATFNRYAKVVDDYRLAKLERSGGMSLTPSTIEYKSPELQESNAALKEKLSLEKEELERRHDGARQEIFVLTMALKAREKTIAEKDREIAQLKRQLASAQQGKISHMEVIRGVGR